MFRNATLKLTAYYLAIVMAISVIFSTVLYHFATHELARGLHRQSDRFFTQIQNFQVQPPPHPDDSLLQSGAHHLLAQLIFFNFLVLFAAGGLSYWLARRTLLPIEAAHEQQKRFTADVSHELRTPLTAMRMESEVALLDDKAPAKELRQTLGSNLEEISKMELLINSLLRLTKLDTDQLQQAFTPVSTAKVITNTLTTTAKLASAKDISITTTDKDYTVMGDETALSQLLSIFVDNAIKYSPDASTITIKQSLKNDEVRLDVTDKGIGIEPEALQHVFDRFYRADSSRTRSQAGGYGLGLSIAKSIADMHNAAIDITSAPDKGTTVSLRLAQAHPTQPAPTSNG